MIRFVRILLLFLFVSAELKAEAKTLDLYWIDVEGGAATLIVTPDGESVLIDAGQDLERDVSRIHHVAVKVAGLKAIDHFVTTHWHGDHYGGVMNLSERIPIKRFYDRGEVPAQFPEDPNFPVLMARYQKMTGGKATGLDPGNRVPLRGLSDKTPLELVCLASSGKLIAAKSGPSNSICSGKKEAPKDDSDNAKSVVLMLRYGKFSFFDGGDLTRQMEEKLVCPINRVGTVDLLQIDHHGLDLSNSPALLRTLNPRVVIVNNGPDKGAENETMKTLKGLPGIETIWQVHRNLQSIMSETPPRA